MSQYFSTDTGALAPLDRAMHWLSHAGWATWRDALVGGAWWVLPLIVMYYLAYVEGVRGLRFGWAVWLVVAWHMRAFWLGRAARRLCERVSSPTSSSPTTSAALTGPALVDGLRLASLVLLGVTLWAFFFLLVSFGTPWALLGVPIMAIRGGIAPTWIARVGCETSGGVAGLLTAAADHGHARHAGVFTEGVLLAAMGVVFVNLFAFGALFLSLFQSLFGFDVATVAQFMSLDNTFAVVVMGGVSFVCLEPLRVAVSVAFFVDGKMRREGHDLTHKLRQLLTLTLKLMMLAVSLSTVGNVAVAQESVLVSEEESSQDTVLVLTDDDKETQQRVAAILAQDAFREFSDAPGASDRLLDRMARWLDALFKEATPRDEPTVTPSTGLSLPFPPVYVLVVLVVLLLLFAVLLYWRPMRRSADADADEKESVEAQIPEDPRERSPEAHLDDAALLAQRGLYRDALRALYVATLVALDRQAVIRFEVTRTNGHYLKQMHQGAAKRGFGRFTTLFDRVWYGDVPAAEAHYKTARMLAEQLQQGALHMAARTDQETKGPRG